MLAHTLDLNSSETQNPHIYINECRFGKGVFAAENINKGQVILTFTGKIIDLEAVLEKGEKESNPLQIDTFKYIDIEEPGVLVNHSCSPNAGILNDTILVAIADIYQNEEITFDYSTTMSEDLWTMKCECLSSNCRGIVRDFEFLSKSIQEEYLLLGIVQSFIVRKMLRVEPMKQ